MDELIELTPWCMAEMARYLPEALCKWMDKTVQNAPLRKWSDDGRTDQEFISDWMKKQVAELQESFILPPQHVIFHRWI